LGPSFLPSEREQLQLCMNKQWCASKLYNLP